jgi:HrpA-like RNA helicase
MEDVKSGGGRNPFEGCCALIIDEAHERNLSTDLLLGMIKAHLALWPMLKVIVTSATLDTKLFSSILSFILCLHCRMAVDSQLIDYFDKCPVIEIPGRTFPVEVIMSNSSFLTFRSHSFQVVYKPTKSDDALSAVLEAVQDILKTTKQTDGDLLCFLTGQDEVFFS